MLAILRVLSGCASPDRVEVPKNKVITIGRRLTSDISIATDILASRDHAKIHYEDDQFFITDHSRNGTFIDGKLIQGKTPLYHESVIRIGESNLQFLYFSEETTVDTNSPEAEVKSNLEVADANSFLQFVPPSMAKLKQNEMNLICDLITQSFQITDSRELIKNALHLLLKQTKAAIGGYLSLDPDDLTLKIVVPEQSTIDTQLSKYLTKKLCEQKSSIWLGRDIKLGENSPESLVGFLDAIGLLLGNNGLAIAALHIYQENKPFSEYEFEFCEVVGRFLSRELLIRKDHRKMQFENIRLRSHSSSNDDILGESQIIKDLRAKIRRVAPSNRNILITGESGSGKELVALALHRQSARHSGPFVPINCAAIIDSLFESECFGFCKGSFNNATRDHAGYFEQADEGTLFLDEIGEIPWEQQAKLLRVIETKSFRPIGANKDVRSDVRLLFATNRHLQSMVKEKKFREDLLFRISVVEIYVPPLREHAEDIPILINFFLERLSSEFHARLGIQNSAVDFLKSYSWPGNVRQLRSVLENLVANSENGMITKDDIERVLITRSDRPTLVDLHGFPASFKNEDVEKWNIQRVLTHTQMKKKESAELLGITRETLNSKIKKFKLNVD